MLAVQDDISSPQFAVTARAMDPRPSERIPAPMTSRFPLTALYLSAMFAMLLFAVLPACAAPPLAGTYKITENTDLGSEIRLTVQLNLFNPGDAAVTVTRVSLRSISAPGQWVSTVSNVVVQSHANSQLTLQFLIAKKDFNTWQVGPHQQFLVTLQPAGGQVTLVNLPLLRTRE
jgi:hypothetical protein